MSNQEGILSFYRDSAPTFNNMIPAGETRSSVVIPCQSCNELIQLTGTLVSNSDGSGGTFTMDSDAQFKYRVHILEHGPFIGPTYTPVNKYEECDRCNYDDHTCHFCGQSLDHEGREGRGTLHDTAYCRPDLVEHEPGPICTWPDDPELNEYREPWCYWDHEKNELRD